MSDIMLIYIVLFALMFIGCGISLMVSEGYLKDILIISLLNVFFLLAVIVFRATDKLAKRKLRHDFDIKPDDEDGRYYYKMGYWKQYGGNIEENTR